ncbi:MAG: peptidase inhibitor I78 [Caulobacteraceae bacterium]|nr:peptidase inhibitor I78 [Caulobacteraceae bacterium]
MAEGSLKVWGIAVVLALSACLAPAPAPRPPSAPVRSSAPATPPAPAYPAPRPPATASDDLCGAKELQSLVGRPRTEIPVPVLPSRRQVVCSSCPMSRDYTPYRQTIIYDADTGRVKEVRCG